MELGIAKRTSRTDPLAELAEQEPLQAALACAICAGLSLKSAPRLDSSALRRLGVSVEPVATAALAPDAQPLPTGADLGSLLIATLGFLSRNLRSSRYAGRGHAGASKLGQTPVESVWVSSG